MRIVCGLDVCKDSIYLCILSSTGEIIEKVFGFLTVQFLSISDGDRSMHRRYSGK